MDRRSVFTGAAMSVLTAGAAAALPATAFAASHCRAWDAAMAEYIRTKHAMETQEGEEVVGHFIDAEKAILNTRPPDFKAFRWKVERMRDISEHSVIDEEDFDQLLADIACLMGDA
jgi:hypothetical protein